MSKWVLFEFKKQWQWIKAGTKITALGIAEAGGLEINGFVSNSTNVIQKELWALSKKGICKAINPINEFHKSLGMPGEKNAPEAQETAQKGKEKKLKKGNQTKDDTDTTIYTSLYEDYSKQIMAEQVFDGKKVMFAVYNHIKKTIEYVPEINVGALTYKPINDEEVYKKAVLLPSKAIDYGTDEELDEEIKGFIIRWLDIPTDFLQFSLWNIKRSWVYQRFHTLNYLRALGDTGQGKTRFLDTLGSLHYKPIMVSGATTAAPVFRIIDKWRGTMVFDEGDFKKSDETEQIVKIINMGYEKGKFVMRCDGLDFNKIQFFDPFCPKLISTRKPFEDKAVESRCITQVMIGTRRRDIKFTLDDAFDADALQLRNKLLMWRFKNYYDIDISILPSINIDILEPRVQQIIYGYFALFGLDDQQISRFYQFIHDYQQELIDDRANSWEGQVVAAIHELLEGGAIEISAQDIIEKGQMTNDRGQFYKPRALTNVLKELGFGKAVVKRVQGASKRCLPLEKEHLNNLFERYGVTVVTVVTGTPEKIEIRNTTQDVTIAPPPHKHRNNRNIVTDIVTETPTELLDFTENHNQQVVNNSIKTQIESALTKFENGIKESDLFLEIDTHNNISLDEYMDIIDIMKSDGIIVEMPKGTIRLL